MYNNFKPTLCVTLIKCFIFLTVLLTAKDVVDNYCFNIDYEVPESSTITLSTEFMARIRKSEEKVPHHTNDTNYNITNLHLSCCDRSCCLEDFHTLMSKTCLKIVVCFFFFNSKWFEFSRVSDLSRCFLAFYVVALVVFLLAFIFGLVVCCWRRSKWAYIAGLCAYIAGNDTVRHAPIFYLSVTKIEIIFCLFFIEQMNSL